MASIVNHLAALGISVAALAPFASVTEEFSFIKTRYHKRVLEVHPDKPGGSDDAFRTVNEAFSALRNAYSTGEINSFKSNARRASAPTSFADFMKPYEFYSGAATEPVPLYKVELAKSGRSLCNQGRSRKGFKCGMIEKGSIRIGSLDAESGSYTRWIHLTCWRVPRKIWLGLPTPASGASTHKYASALADMNEVLLCGFNVLSSTDKAMLVRHVMDSKNWASYSKMARNIQTADSGIVMGEDAGSIWVDKQDKTDREEPVKQEYKQEYKQEHSYAHYDPQDSTLSLARIPRAAPSTSIATYAPSKQAAVYQPSNNILAGKTIVLTGTFPEVGGGAGLNLGKDRLKSMLEAQGARVTGAVSGKTSILVVGTAPGMSKVLKAREQPNCMLVSFGELRKGLEGKRSLEIEDCGKGEDLNIVGGFSRGYHNNGLAMIAAPDAFDRARGVRQREMLENGGVKTKKARRG